MVRNIIIFITVLILTPYFSCTAQQLFSKHYGYVHANPVFMSSGIIIPLADDQYLISGFNNDSLIFLLNLNESGDFNWSKVFKLPTPIGDGLQTTNGYYFVFHKSMSFTNCNLFKTDLQGNFLWGKSFSNPENNNVISWKIQELNDQNILIVGYTGSTFMNDTIKMFLMKIDGLGNIQWQKSYLVNGYILSRALAAFTIPGGNLLVFGDCQTGSPNPKGFSFAMKITANGDLVSCQAFNRKHSSFLRQHSLIKVDENQYLAAGSGPFGQGLIFNRIDSNGVSIEEWNYDGDFYPYDFALLSDHEQVISGDYPNTMIRLDSSGSVIWTKEFEPQKFRTVTATTDGGFISTGYVHEFDSLYTSYSYIVALKTNKDLEGACNSADTLIPMVKVNEIPFDSLLSITTFNAAISTTDFILEEDTTQVYSYDCTVGVPEIKLINSSLAVFPNPFRDFTSITYTCEEKNLPFHLQLFNCMGSQVFEMKNISSHNITLSQNNLPSGIYWLRVKNDRQNTLSQCLIIE